MQPLCVLEGGEEGVVPGAAPLCVWEEGEEGVVPAHTRVVA